MPAFHFDINTENLFYATFPVPDDAFMALELVPGILKGVTGMVVYPAEFGEI
ncbi:MAG: hypothetical protein ACOY4I_01425 [Bacillota bacterium]